MGSFKSPFKPFGVFVFMTGLLVSHYFCLNKSARSNLASRCLLLNLTYRLPKEAALDRLIGFRMLSRFVRMIFKNPLPFLQQDKALIYDSRRAAKEARMAYVNWQAGCQADFIAREQLVFIPASFYGLMLVISLFLFLPIYLVSTIFFKQRANIALLLLECVENSNLLMLCAKYGVKRLYFFSPFEKDANASAMLLMRQGVYVSKHPSPGPLVTHNSAIIANELVLSSQYQVEEFDHFKGLMFVEKLDKWYPENSKSYIERYIDNSNTPPPNKLGYYSSASWLRKKSGHANNGHHTLESEQIVLRCLKELLIGNASLTLIIFMHPRERKPDIIDEAKKYYASFLQGVSYSFVDNDVKTSNAFDLVDIALAAYSTTIYERLFCGFKTLAFYAGLRPFPIAGSPMQNVIIKDQACLSKRVLDTLKQSTEQFFESNSLQGYRYFEYDNYFKRPLSSANN